MQCVAQGWFLVIEKLPLLVQLFQSGNFDSRLSVLISKILFYADRKLESVAWALKGPIDLTERSLYSDTVLATVVQLYRDFLHGKNLENSIEKVQLQKVIEILI